jgi:hypothetical protein
VLLFPAGCKSTPRKEKKKSVQHIRNKSVFDELDATLGEKGWFSPSIKTASRFESIWKKHRNDKNLTAELSRYCSTPDRCYWIGIYLWNRNFTGIANPGLAAEILSQGTSKAYAESDKVRFYWQIGYAWYFSGRKEKARDYLLIAKRLTALYPGTRPLMSAAENREIDRFIRESEKDTGL